MAMEFTSDKPGVIKDWNKSVREGSFVPVGHVILTYEEIESSGGNTGEKGGKLQRLKATRAGVVEKLLVSKGETVRKGTAVLMLGPCKHPTVMKDMCAECGMDLRKLEEITQQTASVSMVHSVPELRVSMEQAQKLGKVDEDRLLDKRKLVLLVDLDQTLIHTTNDNVPNNLKDVFHFQLWGHGSVWYHTRIRPHTRQFLDNISKLYELHICTFGTRHYAYTIAHQLDSSRKLFSDRILSRDECFSQNSKTANLKELFPRGDHMVCIIDDREDVWNFAPNLIHVKPYHFFRHTGDINAPPGLSKKDQDDKTGFQFEGDKVDSNPKACDDNGDGDTKPVTETELPTSDDTVKVTAGEVATDLNLSEDDDSNIDDSGKEEAAVDADMEESNEEDVFLKDTEPSSNTPVLTNTESAQTSETKTEDSISGLGSKESSSDTGDTPSQIADATLQTDTRRQSDNPAQDDVKQQLENLADEDVNLQLENPATEDIKQQSDNPASDDGKQQSDNPVEVKQQSDNPVEVKQQPDNSAIEDVKQQPDNPAIEDVKQQPDNPANEDVKHQPDKPVEDEVKQQPDNPANEDVKHQPDNPAEDSVKQQPDNPAEDSVKQQPDNPADDSVKQQSDNPVKDCTEVVDNTDSSKTDEQSSKNNDLTKTEVDANAPKVIEVEDEDDYLLYLEQILNSIHEAFYSLYDDMQKRKERGVPDVKTVIPYVRKKVLKNFSMVFSGVVPTHVPLKSSKAYQIALNLGAYVSEKVIPPNKPGTSSNAEPPTTHVVAARMGTAKVNEARRYKGIQIVTPEWLWTCAERWELVEEKLYRLDKAKSVKRNPPAHCSSPDIRREKFECITPIDAIDDQIPSTSKGPQPAGRKQRTPSGRFMDSINPLFSFSADELDTMAHEVDDICNESNSSSSDDEEEIQKEKERAARRRSSRSLSNQDLKNDFGDPSASELTKEDSVSSSSSASESSDEEDAHPFERRDDENFNRKRKRHDKTETETEDEPISVKFRRGEPLPSDIDSLNLMNQSSEEEDDTNEEDDWMAQALEREFLDENSQT